MFGRSREQLLGVTPESLSPPYQPDGSESAAQSKRIMQAAMEGREQHYFWRMHRPDGMPIDLEIFVTGVSVAGKRLLQATVHDVTERRRAELKLQNYAAALEAANRELERSNAAAEAATRAKSEFLANMSHEIRTPMTAIIGFVDILAEHAKSPIEIEAVETIKRNGSHLLRIINDILDLAKVEAGKMEIERVVCSPTAMLDDVVSLMRVRSEEKRLALTVELDGPIPDTIHTDPTRLRQILVNLLGNAIKFTDHGGVNIAMGLLTYDNRTPQMRFHVKDTGIGMSKEMLAKIFQPFSQGHRSLHAKYGGTGLGLAISRRLAEALGGSITAESETGVGSTFTLTIDAGTLNAPIVHESADAALSPEAALEPAADQSKTRLNCRVLLAEDGPDNQRLLTFLLTRAGAETVVVENGQLAVHAALDAAAQGKPFDVLLMDMQMPVLDGYEATRQLRNAGYTRPIVALTAHAMNHDRAQCLRAGCDAYLAKPIDRHTLLQTVAVFASKSSQPANASVETPVTKQG
jgi:PAS domain S-box-containing protein